MLRWTKKDEMQVYLFLGILTYLGCTVYHLYDDNTFDFMGFGLGFSALLAGGGAGLKLKGVQHGRTGVGAKE